MKEATSAPEVSLKNSYAAFRTLKATKYAEFSAKTLDDKEEPYITGVLAMNSRIIICDSDNTKFKLFDEHGSFLYSINSKHRIYGIHVTNSDCGTFVTCSDSDEKIHLWTLRNDVIYSENVSYDVDLWSHGISYNGTYYSVLHFFHNTITVLDTQGSQVRKIVITEAFGKDVHYGWDIHMDSTTHNIYVPCEGVYKGVMCVSMEGDVLWLTPLLEDPWGITAINDLLCVTGWDQQCVHLMTKTGQNCGKLLDKEHLTSKPFKLCYDKYDKRMYISFEGMDTVSIFSIELQ